MSAAVLGSAWVPVAELPDAECTVLLRLDNEGFPVLLGFHDEGGWRDAGDASLVLSTVSGWMHLDAAASLLDGGQREGSGR